MLNVEKKPADEKSPLKKKGKNRLQKISFFLILFAPLIAPLAFVPSNSVPFLWTKSALVIFSALFVFIVWIISRLKDGKISFPSSWILLSAFFATIATLLSALFSGSAKISLIGSGVDAASGGILFILFLLAFLVSIFFNSKQRILYSYIIFFIVFLLIALFHLIRLFFGSDVLTFGIFTDVISNTVGRWNDLSIFFGAGAVLSLVTLELVSLSRRFKILASIALAVSLFFLALVNFSPVWPILAFFSLIFMVHVISFGKGLRSLTPISEIDNEEDATASVGLESPAKSEREIPTASLVVLLVSLVFIFGGRPLGLAISNKFNVAQIDARPSWSATMSIAKSTLAKDPILGSGPNRFVNNWLLFKPDGVNQTIFWNVDFTSGIGLISSFIVTGGLLVSFAWLLFLIIFVYAGFKAVLSVWNDSISRYLASSSFLVALFLWISSIIYTPSLPLVALAYFFSGLFVASLVEAGVIKIKTLSFIDNPQKSFISVLALVLLLIGAVSSFYLFAEKFVAAIYFQKGLVTVNTVGDFEKAERYIEKAISIDPTDAEYRALTQIDMVRIQRVLANTDPAVSPESARADFQRYLTSALSRAGSAVTIDSSNYQNWLSLGQVYEAVVPLKIQNAYESALNGYKQALSLNPKSPSIFLTIARLEAVKGDDEKAKASIAEALKQKGNYTEAIFLLSQLQVREGNLKDAITSVEAASVLSPQDSGVFFELGLLKYNNKDYQGSAVAMETAVKLNPSYANAKYFLGLSYEKLGRDEDAIKQFQDLKETNPDNKEIELSLKNLTTGRQPFSGATPPIDDTPEKRKEPPVVETTAATKKKN